MLDLSKRSPFLFQKSRQLATAGAKGVIGHYRNMRKIISLAFLIICIVGYVGWFHTESGCGVRDGHWASNGSYCITRSCYKNQDCGNWASPIGRCNNLEIGDNISEVYFQLGQPLAIDGTTYTWRTNKITGQFVAEIDNDQLKDLSCHTQ